MSKRLIENPGLSTRVVAIHADFKPDGDPRENMKPLMDLWIEVQEHLNRVGNRELAMKKKEWRKFHTAIDQLTPLIASVMGGDQNASAISDEVRALVPDEALRTKVFDWYSDLIRRKPQKQTPEELAAQEKELDARDKALKCSSAILDSLNHLSKATEEGDPAAAEALLEAATTAVGFLTIATSRHPQLFKELAEKTKMWPVIASDEPGWEKAAVAQVAQLELGKGLAFIKTRLRALRGSDVALPARRWARTVVQTIDETRWRFPLFLNMVEKLGGSGAWADFAMAKNWDIANFPEWVKAAMALKPFSVETFDAWKAVVREIIREQVPDFHLRPEWATQRMTAEANGRDTPGEIQNAILDDIVSALKRFAPEPRC